MSNRLPVNKALNTERSASFQSGQNFHLPTDPNDAGVRSHSVEGGGEAFNKGRLKPGTEVHYAAGPTNGQEATGGTASIPNNPGAFTGRDNAPR